MSTIYTLNARGYLMLEVMTDYFKLTHEQVFSQINLMHQELVSVLKHKSVKYEDLRSALVPSVDRFEAIFVFDSLQISSNWYGNEVFKRIIPLFDKRSNHSILAGDYIGSRNREQDQFLYNELTSNLEPRNPFEYKHCSQFYFVYINNLSQEMLEKFDVGLSNYKPYIGHVDVTFSSVLKQYCSRILCHCGIKHKSVVIMSHEDDRDNDENVNMLGYPFEKYGYKCLSLQDTLFGNLLSYKIECPVLNGFERDRDFSLNSISKNVLTIDDFDVEIDDRKLVYLRENKEGIMKKSEMIYLDKSEIEYFIRERLASNYIYNMTYLEEYGTSKFNIMLEKELSDGQKIRLMLALEYMPQDKKLRLITMI
ncbi:hypothetical protein [Proteus mirabilis]|nr:hypothetical protein [Proteus mirabilis]MCW9741216.1 hypothetical protein [Proteus mirabilis]MDH7535669.1 hypothetical protein [Proteus mirabilis]MDM3626574.1 hypothetical protein [Proteus mirabilis]MDM3631346.1 hypothetical protein [Proteus mirabilis]MDM3637302.1 hypothetical protein [Proteus mirabilis]